ncbi:lipopolysaccharide biosynthesis protein [Parasporobacterium paucivorans]|uniref:Membrane protein involved in the export of O-antigen and teichoic acid n=1 Tax=Parasporobacterium paucivorans DSM 15970 TaxID=1122934 RepID=A0A1M6GV25_9FIRM|nr:oligosaccharide flippase family protein [Parasporobacterium paucivorans]SHJ13767.1 Membrane protein involved in the export of O-antigen and teichoic acid [Parasporobacterium paucivorans DSM 15970]
MNTDSRAVNSIRNTIFGVINQVVKTLLTFVCRTILIKTLGAQYLGINGLYLNILSMLSLAELGVGNVLIYTLYKPIAAQNTDKIRNLLIFFRRIYSLIAVSVLVLGLMLVPLLKYLVKSELPYRSQVIYYLIFLLNSVMSYFVVYKSILINADQKNFMVNIINTILTIIQNGAQIIILLFFRNYTAFLLVLVFSTIMNNLTISIIADKKYPFLKQKARFQKEIEEKRKLVDNIKATFFYKIGGVLMTSTDNILISIMLGTVVVGYYSNYSMIVVMVGTFISILTDAFLASLGNLNAQDDKEKSYQMYKTMTLFFHWIGAFCTIAFLLVFRDFVAIWVGEEYILDMPTTAAIVITFYLSCISNQNWMYRETMGIFMKVKYLMFIAAMVNLVFSVILGLIAGLPGILIATAIGRVTTIFWREPLILFRDIFGKKVREYWIKQLKYFLMTVASFGICMLITYRIAGGLIVVFLKIAIAFVITGIIFVVFTRTSPELKYLKSLAEKILKMIANKRRTGDGGQ